MDVHREQEQGAVCHITTYNIRLLSFSHQVRAQKQTGIARVRQVSCNAKVEASIDMEYLESCFPSVPLMNLDEVVATGQIPQETWSLYQKLNTTCLRTVSSQASDAPHSPRSSHLSGLRRQLGKT